MQNLINTSKFFQITRLLGALALIFSLSNCEKQPNYEYVYNNPGGKLGVSAWEFLQQRDSFSLMRDAVSAAGLENYYNGSTAYTFIMPRNSAWRSYLKTNGYALVSDVPVNVLDSVLKYHIVQERVIFSDPELMSPNIPIEYNTENADPMYLSHNNNFQGLINQGTRKSWTIITSNLEPTNGVIHVTADVVYLLQ